MSSLTQESASPSPSLVSQNQSARRRVLCAFIASTCHEVGFTSAENSALELLLQLFQAFLTELSHSTKQFCEHSGRTEPLAGDVIMALIEMGFDVKSLPTYAFRLNRVIMPTPSQMPKQSTPKILQTGKRKAHHSYIPDFLPPFPDSHSYISTPTYKEPIAQYETLREKSSTQKRSVERALTCFMARTFSSSQTYSLFPEEQLSHLFPLIGIKTDPVPYLSALLPKDQIWEDEDSGDYKAKSSLKNNTSTEEASQLNELDTSKENEEEHNLLNEAEIVDNPYMRAAKVVNDFSFEI